MSVIVRGSFLPISFKASVNIARFIKGREVKKALKILEGVMEKKIAVPYVKYNRKVAHKPGIGPGRYPVKAARYFIGILKNGINVAKNKGMDENKLYIKRIEVNRSISKRRAKRLGRKATSIIIELEEKK